ncbi:hypothetical protein OG885_09690 [Streptomyces sp. NBC_00028]|uniref:hypothetical protein n=1 Tax=Streptomyces sp. NBC_00028 TaxID=2975624 RepID=UPI00324FF357
MSVVDVTEDLGLLGHGASQGLLSARLCKHVVIDRSQTQQLTEAFAAQLETAYSEDLGDQ